jgi:hypothetical protein
MGLQPIPPPPRVRDVTRDVTVLALDHARSAYVVGTIDFLEFDRAATILLASELVARLYLAGVLRTDLAYPEPMFVYWNATDLTCRGCNQEATVSRWYLGGTTGYRRDPGSRLVTFLCRDCGHDLQAALGIHTC